MPGNGITRGCWDGDFDRDDIYYVYPDNEGTRDTASPLTDWQTAGRSDDPTEQQYMYLRDQVTGTIYLVTFGDTLVATPVAESSVIGTILNAISINNAQEWQLYLASGVFQIFKGEMNGCGVLPTTSTITLNPSTGVTTYTPTEGAPPTIITGGSVAPPAPLRVNEGWEWLKNDATLQVNEDWPLTLPDTGTIRVNEGWES